MKKLMLNEQESKQLLAIGAVEIMRNGFAILIEENNDYNAEALQDYSNRPYNITIIDNYNKVVVKGGNN